MDQGIGLVSGFRLFPALFIVLGIGLGVLHHRFDLAIGQTARRLDADLLFLASRLILGGDIHDAIGVNIEGHFDLRHATGRCRQTD